MQGLPWKRLWKIGKPFWVSEQRNKALLNLVGILVLLAANAGLSVFINLTSGHFMTAIEQKAMPEFYHYLIYYGGAMLVATPVQVYYGLLRTRLAIVWRTWLASALFDGYFRNLAYYKMLNNVDIDNPDQRMCQDVDSFCNSTVGLFISIIDSLVNVVSFIGILWALSSVLTFTVLGYAALGSVVVVFIGRKLPGYNFQLNKTEADLRFSLAEARREAETVAFYHGEEIAAKQAKTRLGAVIDTLFNIMWTYRNIQLFTTLYNMLVPLIPAAIMGPLYFHGGIPFGAIASATGAFTAVFNGSTFLVGQFGGLSSYAATINRVGSFIEALEKADIDELPADKRIEVVEGELLACDKMTVLNTDLEHEAVKELTFEVKKGQSLLITGPDGSGKTSIMRVIAGIWHGGHGRIARPSAANIMFLTQSPYLPPMTLREALSYPSTQVIPDDARLQQVLETVNLPHLIDFCGGFDCQRNWRNVLSISEQQRLGLARIILRQPAYAVIDEATSALESDNEKLLYTLLTSLGTTVVSAGAPSLSKYHTQVLELAGDGSWKLFPSGDYKGKGWRLKILDILHIE